MAGEVLIRKAQEADSAGIVAVWQDGLEDGEASFLPPEAAQQEGLAGFLSAPRLVVEDGGKIIGFAFLKSFADSAKKSHYSGVAEMSIYLLRSHHGHGIGGKLLSALIEASEAEGFWTLLAKIFRENEASRALLLRHGFTEVGTLERLARQPHGRFANQWRDVILFARRSDTVGLD